MTNGADPADGRDRRQTEGAMFGPKAQIAITASGEFRSVYRQWHARRVKIILHTTDPNLGVGKWTPTVG